MFVERSLNYAMLHSNTFSTQSELTSTTTHAHGEIYLTAHIDVAI